MKKLGFNIFRFAKRSNDEFESAVSATLLGQAMADSMGVAPPVTAENSLSLSAVWRCVNILADTVAILPIHLYEKSGDVRNRNNTHSSYRLLKRPNQYMTHFVMMRFLMTSCVLWGNGYARIIRDNKHNPIRLRPIHPGTVEPYLTESENLYYRLANGEVVSSSDMIHIKGLSIDGIKGKSPITIHRENIQLAKYAQEFGSKFFSQGSHQGGTFTIPGELKDEQYNRLKADLTRQMAGMQNAHKPILLEGGMTYARISIPPEDAQYIESRKFQKTEIATIFGVPPHMLADLERSTNNNIEHQGMEFVTYTLLSYLVGLEEEFNVKMLRDDEFDKFYHKFELKNLLRGDAKTRSEYYKNMNLVGAMNANEIRSLEEMNTYDGGDEYFVQLNMQTPENAKQIRETQPNGGATSPSGE